MRLVKFVCALVLLAAITPARANLIVNGDFGAGEANWTHWAAPWGGSNYAITNAGPNLPEGTLSLAANQTGSFGWFQIVPVPVGLPVSVSATWKGAIGGAGWAEIMLWTTNNPLEDAGLRADTGAAADIAFKKDSWGMNPPTAWDWQDASGSPHPAGNGGMVVSQGYVGVALKLGSGAPADVSLSFDNVVLTPEPGALLLLGIPVVFLRRRRM